MNVSELTLLVLRIGFLILLWVFVFVIVYALRSDLFGSRVRKLPEDALVAAPPAAPAQQAPPVASGPVATAPSLPHHDPLNAPAMPVPETDPTPGSSLAGLAIDRTGPHAIIPPAQQGGKATVFSANRLIITEGPRTGVEYELTPDPLTIGRSSESGLVIRDDYTSTHHARLMLWNNDWMIQDLDSTNGTFLDGKRVTAPAQVPLNTPIKVGMTTFELRR